MNGDGSDDSPSKSIVQRVTPNFIRRSFALKFAIVLLVMGLSIGVIGAAATQQVKAEVQDNVRDEYQKVAQQEADLIEQWITRNRLMTRLVSRNDKWATNERLQVKLQTEKSQLPGDVYDMHVIGRSLSKYTIVASTSLESGTGVAAVNRGWVRNVSFARTSEVVMSSVYFAGETPVLGFLSPVASTENRFLLIEYTLDSIATSLQGAEREQGGFTQVVNSDGVIMIDEPAANEPGLGDEVLQSYGTGEATKPIRKANALRRSEGEAGVTTIDGASSVIDDRYTVGYSPVEGTDWVVLVHAPYDSVFGFVQQIRTWGLIATLVGVLLIGGVGATLGYTTSSTIDTLTRKTEKIREGDLDVPIQSSRIDNVGRLYDGFADMRDSLRDQIDEAEHARKEAVVSQSEAMEMNNYLQEKAGEFQRAMEATAAGDMTQRMRTDGENDSMDSIAREFNEMMSELEKTTGQLKSFAEEVAESGDVVMTSSESVRDAAEQVAAIVQRMSDDAYDQQDHLLRLSEDLDGLVTALERVQSQHPSVDLERPLDQFSEFARTIQDVADTSEQMVAESETVAGAAEEQAAELNEVSARAEKLKRYARPLGDILNRFETEAEHEFVFQGGPSQRPPDAEDD